MEHAVLQGEVLGSAGEEERRPRPEDGGTKRPRAYDVVAISAGEGNGLRYSATVLEAAAPRFEGAPVFVDHAQMEELWGQAGNRSLRNVLGVLESVRFAPQGGGSITGTLRVYPGPDSEWFCALVDAHLADRAAGRPSPRVGLSAVVDVQVHGKEVVAIEKVVSVDAVFDPARGGEFVRAVNGRGRAGSREQVAGSHRPTDGEAFGRERTSICAAVRGSEERDAQRSGGVETPGGEVTEERGNMSVEEHGRGGAQQIGSEGEAGDQRSPDRWRDLRQSVAGVEEHEKGGRKEMTDEVVEVGMAEPEGARLTTESVAALNAVIVEARLDKSGLPQPLRDLLRSEYAGKTVVPSQLEARIEALQAAWAASVAQGVPVKGVGVQRSASTGIQVGLEERDRLQALMDRLCGMRPQSEALQGVPPVSGIRELYLMLTGDWEFQGAYRADRVALANVTTSTMTSLVKNSFNKVILDYFSAVDRWWETISAQEDFTDMKDLTLITLGGFGDLPTVSEGAAYTELSWSDAEEVVSFVKKGGYVGVTLEMMDKDETRKFRAIPQKIAIAGYRTLGSLVSALFTDNSGVGPYWPSSQSTYRLFDANYGNLGSSALSASTWDACIQAMYKMTEATSSKRMGIRPSFLMVPIELEKTALTIIGSEGEPGTGDNDVNVRRGSARVVVVPDWTDTNNWAAVADPRIWPGMVIGYRYGRAPEVFIAGEETVGSMFTNDEMRIKARYVVAVGVGDYRPLYKANVT